MKWRENNENCYWDIQVKGEQDGSDEMLTKFWLESLNGDQPEVLCAGRRIILKWNLDKFC
jgi:hypothetical protein